MIRFVYDDDRQITRCGETVLTAWMRYDRDGNILVFRDERGKEIDAIACREETRPISDAEAIGQDLCPLVIIWHVAWGGRSNAKIYRRGIDRGLVQAYFEFWQSVKGVGCWVENAPKRALVEVVFH